MRAHNFIKKLMKSIGRYILIAFLTQTISIFSQNTTKQYIHLSNDSVYVGTFSVDNHSDKFEIARFTTRPKYLRSYLDIELDTKPDTGKTFSLLIKGYHNNELIESHEIFFVSKIDTSIMLRKKTSAVDKNIEIDYRVLIEQRLERGDNILINYKMGLTSILVSNRQLIYLGINLIIVLGILLSLKSSIQNKILNYNWNKSRWAKVIDFTARSLILILFFDEFGLFLKEWGVNFALFSVFRFILGIPGVSHLIFVANFIIIIPSSFRIISYLASRYEENYDEMLATFGNIERYEDYKSRHAFLWSLLIFNISLLLWYGQCLIGDEYDLSGYEFFTLSFGLATLVLFLLVTVMVVIAKKLELLKHYKTKTFHYTSNIQYLFQILTVFFLSFSQTMITKIIVLLPLINKLREVSFRIIKSIPPKEKISETFLINFAIYNKISLLSFIVLTTSSFILILNWQLAITPYPPLDSSYIKGYTISIFYTLYILLYFFIVNLKKMQQLISILWILFTITILHFLNLFAPEWFGIKIDEIERFNFLQVNSELVGPYLTSLLPLLFHLISISIIYILIDNCRIEEKLFLTNFDNNNLFKRYFFQRGYSASLALVIFFFLVFGITLTNLTSENSLLIEAYHFQVAIVFSTSPLIFIILTIFQNHDRNLFKEVFNYGGNDLIEKLKHRNRFLLLYKSWNNNKLSPKGIIYFFLSLLFTFIIFHSTFYLVPRLILSNTDFKLLWSVHNYEGDFLYNIDESKDCLLVNGLRNTLCIDKKSGEILWQKKLDGPFPILSIVKDSLLWIADRERIELININTQDIYYSRLTADKFGNYYSRLTKTWESFIKYDSLVLVKEGETIYVLDSQSGVEKLIIKNVNSPLPHLRGGPIVYKNKKSDLWFYCNDEKPNKMGSMTDSIIHIISYPEEIIIITSENILLINKEGKIKWSIPLFINLDDSPEEIDCKLFDNNIIFAFNRDKVFYVSRLDGKIVNKVTGLRYAFLSKPRNPFNKVITDNDNGILLYDNVANKFLLFDENGLLLTEFAIPNEFTNSSYIYLSNKFLYLLDIFSLYTYTVQNGELFTKDNYQFVNENSNSQFLIANLGKLEPHAVKVSENKLYWTNFRGIFTAEYSKGNL